MKARWWREPGEVLAPIESVSLHLVGEQTPALQVRFVGEDRYFGTHLKHFNYLVFRRWAAPVLGIRPFEYDSFFAAHDEFMSRLPELTGLGVLVLCEEHISRKTGYSYLSFKWKRA